jgi:hypothetical protein
MPYLRKPLRHARQPHTATTGKTTHRAKSLPEDEAIQRYEDLDAEGEEEKEGGDDEEEEQELGAPWCEEPLVPLGLADEDGFHIRHKLLLLLLLLLGLLRLRLLWLLLQRHRSYVRTSDVAKPPC